MAPATIDLNKNPDKLATFKNALAKAPKDILERSILEAAQRDGRVAKTFWDALVATGSLGTGAKYETCQHCAQSFDTTANKHDSCAWHYGNLVADDSVWVDYYEADQGPIGSKENRKQLPQGFFWDCCGLQMPAEGCLRTAHASRPVLTRNGRVLEAIESERTKARWGSDVSDRDVSGHGHGPSATKKRKLAATQTTCRTCGEMYDEGENTARVCRWHDLDAIRRFTGEREDWDSDEDQCYSENEEEEDDEDEDEGGKIQWTCCGHDKKEGGGCIVSTHRPPRFHEPKVPAVI
ncbi:hypothetical protein FB451DRAFT_754931 [Mycena latifolia]|nr:hypothetical protein FB451DRAFT_754931 [Mycena latifolia]